MLLTSATLHHYHHHHHHHPQLPTKTLQKPTTRTLVRSSVPLRNSAIQRIAEKLRSLGFTDPNPEPKVETTAGEIFIPLPHRLPKHRVGHTLDQSWSTPENPVPEPGAGTQMARFHELREFARREKESQRKWGRKEKVATFAERSLAAGEIRRLQRVGIELRKKLKVGKAGITEGIVNGIHERWRRHEVVKIACEDLCRLNMKRTHDLLERKTGGMVVWRSGSKIILYRGPNYKYPYFLSDTTSATDPLSDQDSDNDQLDQIEGPGSSSSTDGINPSVPSHTQPELIRGVGSPDRVRFQLPGEAQLVEEADCLLDGLGPRFNDWWGYKPLPVDGDLLPAIIPGYRRPFRLLPYGVQPKLTNDEMTTIRRLGRPVRCHFVLGRNRNLQGLAAAIVKLWEKCEIAKIAVKRGVQNTNSELMAEELKLLTGGTVLSRDREFIVFYRGKDFLPSVVASAIEERRKHEIFGDSKSEEYRASSETAQKLERDNTKSDAKDNLRGTTNHENILVSEPKKQSPTEAAIERTTMKLAMALEKKVKADQLLVELEKAELPQQHDVDKEGITQEERYMLRKVGLRMKPFLLLGRRGAFAGTIENMHLHWKYRELVKVICKEKSVEDVHKVAQTLEVESSGVLVAIEKVYDGYAIIMYRGKNYERPVCLRPQTLLNKRQAMKRSLEAQRCESLKLHVLELTRNIDELKLQLVKDKEANSEQLVDESILFMAGDKCGQDSNSMYLNNGMVNSTHNIQAAGQDKLVDSSWSCDGTENGFKFSSESFCEETQASLSMSMPGEGPVDSTCPDNFMSEGMSGSADEHCISDTEPTESSVRSAKREPEVSDPVVDKTCWNKMASRSRHLSNRDRLLLRKQALVIRKRPVLAVGRSNIISGVAKQIKAHFERHPFAIVNVKGRAEGTSIQEVVFKLEQATGAVLVSQEPSKVILYRGWGAGDEPRHTHNENARDLRTTSVGKEDGARPAVSPELIAAIKLECGLHCGREERARIEAGS
ncbi:CRS1_YhbY domain-containing protein [Cephalotus follicularis]|uniref:CRS1_YhbY domain-containing protein n=1 Tax=Cephalotus follicularis TaxID=3775 RepID=A0A1Q3C437_CEPFO|nr:CRS1_YhbY domain-containing protein [Cephalotus follicularis]